MYYISIMLMRKAWRLPKVSRNKWLRLLSTNTVLHKKDSVRIGCASGFWGDTAVAANQLVKHGEIDYLVFDYLSEITMSLLTAARRKNPDMGYAPDFVTAAMKPNLLDIVQKEIKVISNAGGINPKACSEALKKLAEAKGMNLEIATITGDNILPGVEKFKSEIKELGSGKPLPEAMFVSMNAYLGAIPIKRALDLGAQVVITGRCVDSAVVLAPLMHEFDWATSDYGKLSAGSLAGHLVECGAQSTGGIFTDWQNVEDWHNIGFPIVDCNEDGSFILTKPANTGGLVTAATVAEQLTYEIGDPSSYILPDVVCDFCNVHIEQVEEDSVKVSGAKGRSPTDSFKVCATYLDGFRVTAVFCVGGKRAIEKGHKTAQAIIKRVQAIIKSLGMPDFRRIHVQAMGDEALYGKHARTYGVDGEGPRETAIWMTLEHEDRSALDIFAREIAAAGTGMAPGLSAIVGGRPRPSPILKLFSFLHPKKDIQATVDVDGRLEQIQFPEPTPGNGEETVGTVASANEMNTSTGSRKYILEDLAYARSGDKGNSANIGVIARCPSYVPYLRKHLTEEAVLDYFRHLFDPENMPECPVVRYEMPGINAFNFVLTDCLGGGGVASLRTDPQGKALAQMLLDFEFHDMPDLSV